MPRLVSRRCGRRLSPLEGVAEDREEGCSEGKAFPSLFIQKFFQLGKQLCGDTTAFIINTLEFIGVVFGTAYT